MALGAVALGTVEELEALEEVKTMQKETWGALALVAVQLV